MQEIKGYKIFNSDWTCRGFRYEVGKIYEIEADPVICKSGFHFCMRASDCFNYYSFDPKNKVAEVIALGKVVEQEDKSCTNKIHIIREIPWHELLTIANSGDCNSGYRNSGDCNSGHRNSGDCNSGDYNSGYYNSGHYNSGHRNSGHRNSGDCNSGHRNNGHRNSGNYNSGNYNSGHRNSGDCNSGDYNSGNYNSGDYNSGYFNIASNTVGCFNTENQELRFFDKITDITREQWINSEAFRLLNNIRIYPTEWIDSDSMSDKEKEENPKHATLGGYLKRCNNTDCYNEWWSSLTKKNKNVIKSMPNFDADKFLKITGINVLADDKA